MGGVLARLGVLWLAIGCSQPAPRAEPRPFNPDDDPSGDPPPRTEARRWKYDWERRRAAYAPATGGPYFRSPCNPRRLGAAPSDTSAMLFSPKGPQDMAALVLRRQSLDHRSTTVYLDRGIQDGVDTTWSAALLDDAGRPVHAWVCLEIGNDDRGQFVVPMRERETARYSRVALLQDPPALFITDASP